MKTGFMVPVMMFFLVFVLAGCETTKGFGKDIQYTGEVIQDAVEKTTDAL
ncbi:MAG: entericidin [Candidatus Omnitrophota bacterium]